MNKSIFKITGWVTIIGGILAFLGVMVYPLSLSRGFVQADIMLTVLFIMLVSIFLGVLFLKAVNKEPSKSLNWGIGLVLTGLIIFLGGLGIMLSLGFTLVGDVWGTAMAFFFFLFLAIPFVTIGLILFLIGYFKK